MAADIPPINSIAGYVPVARLHGQRLFQHGPSTMKRRIPLTIQKRASAQRQKRDKVMKGTRLALPAGVADRYATKLERLTAQMVDETQAAVEKLFRHPDVQEHIAGFGADISPASQARILTNQLSDRFEQLFTAAAKPTAEEMVDQADDASAAAVHNSLRHLSGGLSLKTYGIRTPAMEEFMKAMVANNVSLIKSIPSEFFRDVQQAVLSSITDGKGLQDLTAFFENRRGVEHRRAKNIAIDQTHKAYNGLNKERMQKNGVQAFEWVHSGGGIHPREHHINPWPAGLNGGHFEFSKLPIIDERTGERGIPGQAINCRCTMVPIIKFEDGEPAQ